MVVALHQHERCYPIAGNGDAGQASIMREKQESEDQAGREAIHKLAVKLRSPQYLFVKGMPDMQRLAAT